MLNGIRNTTAVLAPVLIGLVMTACGGPSETDIDAAVEARVEPAKAFWVSPTAVPLPTYASMPPTL